MSSVCWLLEEVPTHPPPSFCCPLHIPTLFLAPTLLPSHPSFLTSCKLGAEGSGCSCLYIPMVCPSHSTQSAYTHSQELESHMALGAAGVGLEFRFCSLLCDVG